MNHSSNVLMTWSPTPTIRAIRIAKPGGFRFQTSQAVRMILGDHYRPLSIASSPHRDHLEFAVRRSQSDFKKAFFALKEGDPVELFGPRGAFLLERERPVVMLAAGIGITPFRSMLQTVADEGGALDATLLYASGDPGEVAFRNEIDDLTARAGVRTVHSVSRAAPESAWPHRVGRVDRPLVEEVLAPGAVYYLAGPMPFVESMSRLLTDLGVSEGDLRLEMFRGYTDDPSAALAPSWDERYQTQRVEEMPWFYPALDPDVGAALDRLDLRTGRALDVGSGPGTQAIALARRGFEVTGTDISPSALEGAAARARDAGVEIAFLADDVLDSSLTGPFQLILDRGCFHTLAPDDRPAYLRTITSLLAPDGLLLLKCFSEEQPGTLGPRRVSPGELRSVFEAGFEVVSIDRTVYQGTLDPLPKALFSILRRR